MNLVDIELWTNWTISVRRHPEGLWEAILYDPQRRARRIYANDTAGLALDDLIQSLCNNPLGVIPA